MRLKVHIDLKVISRRGEAIRFGENGSIQHTVQDGNTGVTETYLNLTVKPSPNKVDQVLKNYSNLMVIQEGATVEWRANPHGPDPAPGKTIWTDTNS